ncbi:MAG: hypothetical protein ACFFEF_00645 [Candidatus Thorarchaeota archaeon]
MSDQQTSDTYLVGQLLVVFGAIVSFIFGVLYLLNVGVGVTFLPSLNLAGILGAITNFLLGIILVILSLITLATYGIIKIPTITFERNQLVLLILGVAMYVFGGTLGGVLVVIGSILMFF